jgi:hypothetical protein
MQAMAATRASNEALTELALDSAIALDKRLHRQPVDSHAVTAFLDALDRIVKVPERTGCGSPHSRSAQGRSRYSCISQPAAGKSRDGDRADRADQPNGQDVSG